MAWMEKKSKSLHSVFSLISLPGLSQSRAGVLVELPPGIPPRVEASLDPVGRLRTLAL